MNGFDNLDERKEDLYLMAAPEHTSSIGSTSSNYKGQIIQRWMHLFGYTQAQAEHTLQRHLSNAFSNQLSLTEERNTAKAREYIFELEPPLDTIARIRDLTGLDKLERIVTVKEEKRTSYIVADDAAQAAIKELLYPVPPEFLPMIIPAAKDLSTFSIAPTLGIDATLPQYRIDSINEIPFPAQNQYPVTYFLPWTFWERSRLRSLLGMKEPPVLKVARVRGAHMRVWREQYRALLEGSSDQDVVIGYAYEVPSRGEEDSLRNYEGRNFEVVRCTMELGDGEYVKGLTFRFCGDKKLLPDPVIPG